MSGSIRRVFSTEYKLSILAEYDRCSESGDKGALLRREGLYSSIITDWRRQHREGVLVVSEGRALRRVAVASRPLRGRPTPRRERTIEESSSPRPKRSSRSREKCRRSWKSSPRARTPTTRRRHPRHRHRRARPDRRPSASLSSLGRSRATHYRQHRTPRPAGPQRPRPRSHRALTDTQVDEILAVLN